MVMRCVRCPRPRRPLRRLSGLLACSAWLAAASWPGGDLQAAPLAGVGHVVLISVDGLRPDVALRADMPRLRSLLREGAFSFWARTTAMSVTLPSHTSMLTGVEPDRHQIQWNRDLPLRTPVYPAFPTVMELATRAGLSTAMAAGKSKFSTLDKPGTIGSVFLPATADSFVDDAVVADHAVQMIRESRPSLLFIQFPGVDIAGHTKGWGSPEQLAAAARIDAQLGRLLNALEAAQIRASTVVLVSADHGGAGRNHGPDDARSRHIPWILAGPGVKQGYDLTQDRRLEIRTEDTAATVCLLLGLHCGQIDGVAVKAALLSP